MAAIPKNASRLTQRRCRKGTAPIQNSTADVEIAVYSTRIALAAVVMGLAHELAIIMRIRVDGSRER